MDKTELRSHLKQLRQNLSNSEQLESSQQICRQLEAIDWSKVRNLHCFEPITKLGEVDITGFIATLQTQYPKIQLYTSRLIDGDWKIVSWKEHRLAQALQFDAVVIPMLGFDSSLHRIGYGGRYYDTFLATQKHARKIGVCFEQGRVQYIPAKPHDIALDIIVTEANVYSK
jgi:5-formyltetrahydrofolate cyclo-ligase